MAAIGQALDLVLGPEDGPRDRDVLEGLDRGPGTLIDRLAKGSAGEGGFQVGQAFVGAVLGGAALIRVLGLHDQPLVPCLDLAGGEIGDVEVTQVGPDVVLNARGARLGCRGLFVAEEIILVVGEGTIDDDGAVIDAGLFDLLLGKPIIGQL